MVLGLQQQQDLLEPTQWSDHLSAPCCYHLAAVHVVTQLAADVRHLADGSHGYLQQRRQAVAGLQQLLCSCGLHQLCGCPLCGVLE